MKYIYLFLFITLWSLKGYTQGVKYGVRGGMNISSLDFYSEIPVDNTHRNSVYFGALADIYLTKTISLIPELQFSYEGSKAEELQFDYIQMPILVSINIFKNIRVNFGPQIGLKVHEVDDMAANFGFSSILGLEYRINYALFVDVRHSNGLRNVFDDDSGLGAKNKNFQIGVGYKF
ncbi:PorT family protein [Tamlana haliotis]|uniref:PorT family protein n=1 Tax=Pseudotamlana haliotis TaxID=2614804 RepID=A0A6N6MMX6_9FLAO|nr:outer membrane beta-barrel protein [Tamlana haliotis]KAB1071248.1 PorT family protein [Tamlana haliotis]